MITYEEFTKLSIHNHFGDANSEKTLNDSYDKAVRMNYESTLKRLEEAKKNNFHLLALTNANTFELASYITIKIMASELGIELIPGVELNIKHNSLDKYLHTIVLIDPSCNLIDFEVKLESYILQNKNNYITIEQLVDLIIEKKVIIIPHGIKQSSGGKSASENPEQFKEIIAFNDSVPIIIEDNKAYHKASLLQKLEHVLNSKEKAWLEKSANISAADRTSYSRIDSPSYIWGKASFDDLYFAALMKGSRIKREQDIIKKTCYISKIEIIPKVSTPQIEKCTISCSHGLNSIIGKSGSGKTLLLNAIKLNLTGKNLITKTSGLSEYDEIYKDVNIKLFDINGNEISLQSNWKVFEGDNLYSKILTAYSSDKDKLVKELDLDINSSQFDSLISSYSEFLTDYKNNKIELNNLRKKMNNTISSLLSNIDFLNKNKKVSDESIEYLMNTELNTHQEQSILQLSAIEKDLTTLKKIVAILMQFSKKYEVEYEEEISALYTKFYNKILSSEKTCLIFELELKEQIEIEQNLFAIVKSYNATLGKKLEAVTEKKQEILLYMEEIKSMLQQIVELEEKLSLKSLDANDFKNCLKLSENNFSKLFIKDIKLRFDYSDLNIVLDSCIGQKNNKINQSEFKGLELNLENIDSISSIMDVFIKKEYPYAINLNPAYNTYIDYEIQIKSSNGEYEDIESMSAGELGKTYIANMIDKQIKNGGANLIVLFDQPDNNLEKKFILNELVKKIDDLRNHFQIFITTHEPLLVVNADSNNIIKAENNKTATSLKNKINYENLSFVGSANSKNEMIKKIAEMVDGSPDAVKERDKIYGGMLNEN